MAVAAVSAAKSEAAAAVSAAKAEAEAAAAIVKIEHPPTAALPVATSKKIESSAVQKDTPFLYNDPHRNAINRPVNTTSAVPCLSLVNRSISWAADPQTPGRMTVLTYFEWMEGNQSVIRILPLDATCKRTSVDIKSGELGTLDRWGVVWVDLASEAIKRSQEMDPESIPVYWTCMYDHWSEQKAFFTRHAPAFARSAALGRHSWQHVQCLPASQLLIYLKAQSQSPIYPFTTEMIRALNNLEKEIAFKFAILTEAEVAQRGHIIREAQMEAERARQSQLETEMARKNQSRILLRDRARRAKVTSRLWLMKALEAAASAVAMQPAAPVTELPANANEFRTIMTSLISQAIPHAYWDESESDSQRSMPIATMEMRPVMVERESRPTIWTALVPLVPAGQKEPSSFDQKSSSSYSAHSLVAPNNVGMASRSQPLPFSIWGHSNKPNTPVIQSHPHSIPNSANPVDATANKRQKIEEKPK